MEEKGTNAGTPFVAFVINGIQNQRNASSNHSPYDQKGFTALSPTILNAPKTQTVEEEPKKMNK
jgi:hypothetical protein